MSLNNPYVQFFVGTETEVPLLNGSRQRYVNLDNAASTPALWVVQQAIEAFLPYYSSVHRGTGYKSQLSTQVYEQARHKILRFVGADPQQHTCIFVKNTTEAINKLARRFPFSAEKNLVLTSAMEHHSNDLPWRKAANTIHINVTPEGQLDETHYATLLDQYSGHIALVAITGASNVTGYLNPIHRLAAQAHAAGAQILVDCAQLAPHRQVDMRPDTDPGRLDYVTLSAHKMYAPFGTGALIGLRETFEQGDPDMSGGGTVEIVTLDEVVWASPPDREEAGSPNTIGALAFASAIRKLSEIGMENVARHEAELTAYALERLQKVPGIEIFGDRDPENSSKRLGVIPFRLENISHFKLAAILGYEFGIGVRSGCFCAHPYILHLLHINDDEARQVRANMQANDRSDMPGLVRASFGLYNTREDIDWLIEALQRIARDEYQGVYLQDRQSGEFHPQGQKLEIEPLIAEWL